MTKPPESQPGLPLAAADHQPLELPAIDPVRLAAELFIKASAEYPAEALAQAVRLQQLSRQHNQNVTELWNGLSSQASELERIAVIGGNAHRAARQASAYSSAPADLRPEQVLMVTREVFTLSAQFNLATDQQLLHILTVIYPEVAAQRAYRGVTLTAHLLRQKVTAYLDREDA